MLWYWPNKNNSSTPWPCHSSYSTKASADKLNNSFMDAILKLNTSCISHRNSFLSFISDENRTITERLSIKHIKLKEIQHIIEKLPSSTVVGTNHMYVNMLQKAPYVVYEALSIILNLNKLLSNGTFHDYWKSAIVVPVPKKKDLLH